MSTDDTDEPTARASGPAQLLPGERSGEAAVGILEGLGIASNLSAAATDKPKGAGEEIADPAEALAHDIVQRWLQAAAERTGKSDTIPPPVLGDLVGKLIPTRVLNVRNTLSTESDRGCVLVSAAHLDEELKNLLRGFLVDPCAAADGLLSTSGPLGTFSSRIDMCAALGLLSPDACRELHLVRRTRNDFAHVADPISFATPAIASRCSTFQFGALAGSKEPRGRFTAAVMALSAQIAASQYLHLRRTEPAPPDPGLVERNEQFGRRVFEAIKAMFEPARGSSSDDAHSG